MAQHNISSRIILLNDTKANWDIKADKFVLLKGEIGIESDTNKFKIGDGVSTWENLDYYAGDGGSGGDVTIPTELADLLEDENHRTVTDVEKETWNNKAETNDIPKKVSELENDSGFITLNDIPEVTPSTPESSGGNSLPIGMIFPSAVIQNDAGLHLLDGAELPRDGIYAEFYNWVDTNRTRLSLAESVAEYESELQRNDGQCGLFLITDTYVRLPRITHYIENAKDIYMLGIAHKAGLPNITGSLALGWHDNTGGGTIIGDSGSGSLYSSHKGTARWRDANATSTTHNNTVTLDASRSSEIYGNSDTVQPKSVEYPYYIVVGTTVKTEVEVNIDSIITDLNNKADKNASNLSNENVESWKEKLGYKNIETVYDMGSTDSKLNWGYTSGLRGNTNYNKDLLKYKKVITTFYSYEGDVGIAVMDLETAKNPRAWLYVATRVDGTTYSQIYPVSYNKQDKILYIGTIWENTTNQSNSTNFGVSKIQGVY